MERHPRAAPAAARGFTLIELVVTIALLGILVMLSVPSFTGWIRNSQIRTVTEALQTGVRTAQAESVRRNRQVVLFFTDGEPSAGVSGSTKCSSATPALGGKRWAIQTLPGSWGEETSGCKNAEYLTGGKLSDIASSVTITNDKSAKAICFKSDGRLATTASGSSGTGVNAACAAAATTFTVTTAGADRPLKLIVQLGGQLRMCDPNRPTLSASSPDGCP
jgi:type IV fimbrial biogenesis protein FimT